MQTRLLAEVQEIFHKQGKSGTGDYTIIALCDWCRKRLVAETKILDTIEAIARDALAFHRRSPPA